MSYLASDELEGRKAGSTGGHKAGDYIADKFKSYGLIAPNNGSYFQEFNSSWRNVVGYIKGSDSQLSEELIVIGAHYDHVGKGAGGEFIMVLMIMHQARQAFLKLPRLFLN